MENGIYIDFQTREFFLKDDKSVIPEGSLLITEEAREYYLANFHFFDLVDDFFEGIDARITLDVLKEQEERKIRPSLKRERLYEIMEVKEDGTPLILWEEKAISIDKAVKIYLSYLAEGKTEIMDQIQGLIVEGKEYIRQLIPD